ncbi:unnamed protein product, partial [Staurois parvus]
MSCQLPWSSVFSLGILRTSSACDQRRVNQHCPHRG